MTKNSNKLIVPGVEQYLSNVKHEIAQEFGVTFSSNRADHTNHSNGGEVTQRLIKKAQSDIANEQQKNKMMER